MSSTIHYCETLYRCIGWKKSLTRRAARLVSECAILCSCIYSVCVCVCVSKFTLHLESRVYLSGVREFTPVPNKTASKRYKNCFNRSNFCFWVLGYMSLNFRYAGFLGGFANGPNSNRLSKFDNYRPVYHQIVTTSYYCNWRHCMFDSFQVQTFGVTKSQLHWHS